MKTLLRLCSAAVLVAVVTACGEGPTAVKTEFAPARQDGGLMGGGGHRAADGDTTTVNTISGDPNVTSSSNCADERGGLMGGGGHYIDMPACE